MILVTSDSCHFARDQMRISAGREIPDDLEICK